MGSAGAKKVKARLALLWSTAELVQAARAGNFT
jgi:hypothetical protein